MGEGLESRPRVVADTPLTESWLSRTLCTLCGIWGELSSTKLLRCSRGGGGGTSGVASA